MASDEEDGEDEGGDEVGDLDALLKGRQEKLGGQARGGRASVSAEVYGAFNRKDKFKARVIEKTPEQRQRIEALLMKSFMFKALEPKDLQTIIDAMEVKTFK